MKRILIFGAFVALLSLAGCAGKEQDAASSPSLDEVFASRRSVRAYEPGRTISEAQIRELFAATQSAPSWAASTCAG